MWQLSLYTKAEESLYPLDNRWQIMAFYQTVQQSIIVQYWLGYVRIATIKHKKSTGFHLDVHCDFVFLSFLF